MSSTIYIRSGPVRIPVFVNTTRRAGKEHRTYEARFRDLNGHRQRIHRASLAKLKAEVQRMADDLANGRPTSTLSASEVASYIAAARHVSLSSKPIEIIAAEAAEGMQLVPGMSHPELARFYLSIAPAARPVTESISELVETFLLQLEARGLSERHREDLRDRLRRYARENAAPVSRHTAAAVQAWVLGLKLAPRTRNNYLAAVQTLFADSLLSHHPHTAAIRLIKPSVLGKVRKLTWTVEEMTILLANAVRFDPALVPALVLGGFGKMRSSEVLHMHSGDLRLNDRQAVLNAGKTGERLIPLPDNCCEWLRAYAPKDGPMWTLSIDALNAHFRKLAARCGLRWRSNALRKSANTYSLLLHPDYDAVAAAAGNSPRMLRDHYADLKKYTKNDAEKWFSILPPAPGSNRVIVPLAVGN